MPAPAFALSDSAVGVLGVDVFVFDGPWCEAHLCGAVLLPPGCTCVFARAGLMKTPALLVRSPSCAWVGTAQTAAHKKKPIALNHFAVCIFPSRLQFVAL